MIRRLWPDSLTGRIIALLLGITLLLVIGSAVLFQDARKEHFDERSRSYFVNRVVMLVKLLSDAGSAEQQRLIERISMPEESISISDQPQVSTPPSHPVEYRLNRALRRALQSTDYAALFIRFSNDHHGDDLLDWNRRKQHREWSRHHHNHDDERITVSVQLWDERWLNLTAEDFDDPPPWARKTLLLFALLLLLLTVGGFLIVQRMSKPMSRLGQAAEHLGMGQPQPPLPETGSREIRQTIRAFNQMQARLQKQISDRSLMLASVSHDLRTPITTLRLRAESIKDQVVQQKMLNTLYEMEAILTATLQFARDEAADERARNTDIAALLQSLIDDQIDLGGDLQYRGPEKYPFSCKPVALRRALNNLLENAIRYGNRAEVSLREEGSAVDITIDDQGPGIPAEYLNEVFTPFFRLERSRNQETGGTGLGLAVARSIILAHGGEICLSNRDSGGLRVLITLPRIQ